MRGLKASQLTAVVDFIYHGEVNIHQEDLEGFLLLAEELELKGLTGGTDDTGMENQQTQKELPINKNERKLKNENYTISNQEIGNTLNTRTQIVDSYRHTLMSTDMTPKPKVHIANEILQMRETMFEKLEGLWTCKVCNFSSKQSTHLREHVEKHIEGAEYPCDQCGKVMRSSKSLRCHYSGSSCPFRKTRID